MQVSANGIRHEVLTWGPEQGPLVLLLHGYPDTAWTWRHLGPALADRGWRVAAPFLRGYGPTDLAPDDRYFAADVCRDVLALRDALGGDERAVLIGHDWGAAFVYAMTNIAPSAFARYVTMAVPPPAALLRSLSSWSTLGEGLRQMGRSWYFLYNHVPYAELSLGWLIPRLWRAWSPGYDARMDVDHVLRSLDTTERRRASLRFYRNNLGGSLRATLSLVPQAPVLYLHGERDGCIGIEIAELARAYLRPGSRFTRIDGAGHFLQLEAPDRVNGAIASWLER